MKYFRRVIKHYLVLLLGKVNNDVHTELDGAFDALGKDMAAITAWAIREHEEIYHGGGI